MRATIFKWFLIALVGCLCIVQAEEEPDHEPEPEGEGDHAEVPHWEYAGEHGQQEWSHYYDSCGDQRQSPIDIQMHSTIPADFHQLALSYYFSKPSKMRLLNNGHTAQLEVDMPQMPSVKGGGYQNTYEFAQLHFHWGGNEDEGSEHTIDGHGSALEMHLVHYNKIYQNLVNVLDDLPVDGLAVLGVLFEETDEDNEKLQPLIDAVKKIKDPNNVTIIDGEDMFPIGRLLPDDVNDFYFYSGSLTTPGCFEIVSWTVLSDKVPISSRQMSAFRNLRRDKMHPIANNFRETQKHNGRNVYHRSVFHEAARPKAHDAEHKESHAAHHWTYEGTTGPENWGKMYDTCAGHRQSPIDIDTEEVIHADLPPLSFRYYLNVPTKMTLTNNGHTAQLGAEFNRIPEVKGGAIQDVNRFLQLHFHWGADADQGSEHTVDGKSLPLEMHIVHYNTKYESAKTAIDMRAPDGLAVVGVMFEISENDNPAWEPLLQALDKITKPKNSTEITDRFSIGSLLPHAYDEFFTYSGSLTTPGCYEVVTWTVLKDRVPISERQMEHFRNLETDHDHKLVNNYRPTQKYNGRTILSTPVAAAASLYVNTFLSLFMILLARLL